MGSTVVVVWAMSQSQSHFALISLHQNTWDTLKGLGKQSYSQETYKWPLFELSLVIGPQGTELALSLR